MVTRSSPRYVDTISPLARAGGPTIVDTTSPLARTGGTFDTVNPLAAVGGSAIVDTVNPLFTAALSLSQRGGERGGGARTPSPPGSAAPSAARSDDGTEPPRDAYDDGEPPKWGY